MKPTLYIVNGLPGTGKTTLAAHLAKTLTVPLFSKDTLKEVLFDTVGVGDKEHSMRLGKASMLLMYKIALEVLSAGQSCMIEGNFNPIFGSKDIEHLQEKVEIQTVQIFCKTDPKIRIARIVSRVEEGSRHVGHGDPKELDEETFMKLLHEELDPMDIGASLHEVDTSRDGVEDLVTHLIQQI